MSFTFTAIVIEGLAAVVARWSLRMIMQRSMLWRLPLCLQLHHQYCCCRDYVIEGQVARGCQVESAIVSFNSTTIIVVVGISLLRGRWQWLSGGPGG